MTRLVARPERLRPFDRERIDRTRRARTKGAQLVLAFAFGWFCHAIFMVLRERW